MLHVALSMTGKHFALCIYLYICMYMYVCRRVCVCVCVFALELNLSYKCVFLFFFFFFCNYKYTFKTSVVLLQFLCYRYFQSLANNLSFIRYKEVYAAAAEIIGLILNYMTERESVSVAVCSCQIVSHFSSEIFCFTLQYTYCCKCEGCL